MYSFAPVPAGLQRRAAGGQRDRRARRAVPERPARRAGCSAAASARRARMIAAADTGAWSLYSFGGREATLGYHQLIEEFFEDMCIAARTRPDLLRRARPLRPLRARADAHRRSHRCGSLRARHTTTVRFSISKISTVTVRVTARRTVTFMPRPPAASRLALDRLDAAVARALPRADHGPGPERPARRREREASTSCCPKPKPKKKPCKHARRSDEAGATPNRS